MKQSSEAEVEDGFTNYQPPPPIFKGFTKQSLYIPMRDGIKLAIDVVLPKSLAPDDRIPSLLSLTRYWRSFELNAPFSWFLKSHMFDLRFRGFLPFFTSQGYALVNVDKRGTGASYGYWPYPWSEESLKDATEIIDWIVSQPWSNGKVGGYGISYLGTTAELLSVINHPAVKATIPMFNHPDAFIDVAFPGGIYNERFVKSWAFFDSRLDRNIVPQEFGLLGKIIVKGVKPVDNDHNRQNLNAALGDHLDNGNVHKLALTVDFRNEPPSGETLTIEELTVHKYKDNIEKSHTMSLGWGSWMDAGTADAVIRRFLTYDNNQRAVIGAWEHGGRFQASPYQAPNRPANPTIKEQWKEMLRFFDAHLKDVSNGVRDKKVLYYYTMGEEKWKQTHVWPPAGTQNQRWHFSGDNMLTPDKPVAERGADCYTINFEASTGDYNRWWELGPFDFKSVNYPERERYDRHLLTYTSAALEQDTEITGYPIITLYITSTESDGAIYVYLEDVHPDGHVTYITEGQIRVIHRKVSNDPPPYNSLVPYHSFKKEDVLPLVPGEVAELFFGLHPTSVLIRKGHRIRVAIAGHDRGTFKRFPAQGVPVITLERNKMHSSYIELPVVRGFPHT